MDFSQVLASQMINKDTWIENDEDFYNKLSHLGFASLRSAHRKLKKHLKLRALVIQRDALKHIRFI